MKIYLAGERAQISTSAALRRVGGEAVASIWTKHVRRRLFSFYYHGLEGQNFEKDPDTGLSTAIEDSIKFGWDLFLDSGAFTAFTKGVQIPEREYAIYINKCAKRNIWTVCSSLDAIGKDIEAARKSYKYFRYLHRKAGLDVKPVFHVREPDNVLRAYLDEGHEYILIGGMVPESTRDLRELLDHFWMKYLTNADGTAKVKVHGFGLTDAQLMFRYPWHSVDSSSWLMTGIFGSCMFRKPGERKLKKVVFSEESPQARKAKGWHYSTMTSREIDEVNEWVAPYGVTCEQLSQHYSFRDVVNAAVFQSLEEWGTDRFTDTQLRITDAAEEMYGDGFQVASEEDW